MPVTQRVYAARKAAEQCVFDGTPARPGSVLCEGCAARQRAYRDLELTPAERRARELRRRMRQAGLRAVPTPVSHPAIRELLCCGTWWHITHMPLVVPCCGRRWLAETP